MKLLFPVLLAFTLIACGNHRKLNPYLGYVKVVSNSDSTINELSAISESKELNGRLNARFQSVSENKTLYTTIPSERVVEKSMMFEVCKVIPDSCNYVPEGYSFSIDRSLLNLTYQYNLFRSNDLFYKHAVIDLESARRILYLNMFTDANVVLEKYNAKYVKENEDYLNKFDLSALSEAKQEEYDVIRNHLDTRSPFQLQDLNNCELVFDAKKKRFTEIRFHYNGAGGVYKAILSEGYISFTLKELDDLLLKDFKKTMAKS